MRERQVGNLVLRDARGVAVDIGVYRALPDADGAGGMTGGLDSFRLPDGTILRAVGGMLIDARTGATFARH
jgi:hypothetical protein